MPHVIDIIYSANLFNIIHHKNDKDIVPLQLQFGDVPKILTIYWRQPTFKPTLTIPIITLKTATGVQGWVLISTTIFHQGSCLYLHTYVWCMLLSCASALCWRPTSQLRQLIWQCSKSNHLSYLPTCFITCNVWVSPPFLPRFHAYTIAFQIPHVPIVPTLFRISHAITIG